jgi:putative membrane protein
VSGLHLPTLNAILNFSSAVCLSLGLWFIKNGRVEAHKRTMITAFCISTVFLVSYLTWHAQHGSTRFTGTGSIRTVYFAILLTHTLLAAAVAPLAITTLFRGLSGRFPEHRRLARWTWPVWMYVSVTGVVVYWMLYRL